VFGNINNGGSELSLTNLVGDGGQLIERESRESAAANQQAAPPAAPAASQAKGLEPAAAPAALVAPEPAKAKKPITQGQQQLIEDRRKVFENMKQVYLERFGDDKKAPKPKFLNATRLHGIRKRNGDEAFERAFTNILDRDANIFEHGAKYSTRKVRKSPSPVAAAANAPVELMANGAPVAQLPLQQGNLPLEDAQMLSRAGGLKTINHVIRLLSNLTRKIEMGAPPRKRRATRKGRSRSRSSHRRSK
jgi:hypothetical protein